MKYTAEQVERIAETQIRVGVETSDWHTAGLMLRDYAALLREREQAQPVPYRHEWDADGERCVKCGDKDWMGGPCSVSGAIPAQPVSVPTFEEEWLKKEKAGYRYGPDALEQVRFGWVMCEQAMSDFAPAGDARDAAPQATQGHQRIMSDTIPLFLPIDLSK